MEIWLACDASVNDVVNYSPYLEKDEERVPSVSLGELVARKLAESYTGYKRNITTENFYHKPVIKTSSNK